MSKSVSAPALKYAPALRRYAWLAIAPAFALLIYWRVPLTWFVNDDFAWLGLPLEVHRARDLLEVLFAPRAQGTVRFLGERLFFLVFSVVFGFHALPYHLFALATWCTDLVLAALIGERLTGSKAAGVLGAIFWTASSILVTPIAWVSAYNELLCTFCILMAFYARLRGWRAVEWIAYLAGFGALEVIVVYPAIAALHAITAPPALLPDGRGSVGSPDAEPRTSARGARSQFSRTSGSRAQALRTALPLFIPAILFTILHFLLIPKNGTGYYRVAIDGRIFGTLLQYLKWCLGPSRLFQLAGDWDRFGTSVMWITALALALFIIVRLWRREWIILFFCGWFLFLIAPVLPLPYHVTDYYASLSELGLAWLAGWAMVVAWRTNSLARGFAISLAVLSLAGSLREDDAYIRWYYRRSIRIETLFFGLQDALRTHPGSAVLLHGVDNELFQTGFQDDPFRLLGFAKVYFTPGGEAGIEARQDLGGIAPFLISPQQALSLLAANQARVLQVSGEGVRDITRAYRLILSADPRATIVDSVDAGDPTAAAAFGPTWFPPEGGFRWMPKSATVRLSGPKASSQRLYLTGFAPAAILKSGPVTIKVTIDGNPIANAVIRNPEAPFAVDFPLPSALLDRQSIQIALELDKVLRPPGDDRELGMVFGTFSIR